MTIMFKRSLLAAASAALLLVACGGGGEGNVAAVPAATPTAQTAPTIASPVVTPASPPAAATDTPAGTGASASVPAPTPVPAAAPATVASPPPATPVPAPITPPPIAQDTTPAPAPVAIAPIVAPAQGITLSGVAATGAPFAGASITVFDRFANVVGRAIAASDGRFAATLVVSAQPPFVLEAVRDDQTLVSMFSENTSTNLNITPLTTLIAARLAPDGNPSTLRTTSVTAVTTAKLRIAVAEIVALIKPLLTAIGDTVDPLTGAFGATGTGHDKVLDSLAITIHPTGTTSNIEIAVRSASPNPVTISFVSSSPAPTALTGTIATTDLVADGTAQLLADLASRMNVCYGLPVSTRVNSTATTAGAINVVAAPCRTLFVSDDPASYKNNGSVVTRFGAFSTLFSDFATNVVFDRPALEFLRSNPEKDLVFSYRTTDKLGNTGNNTLVARNINNVLKLIGNQYLYDMRVNPLLQEREFINQPASTYQSVGYNVFISNLQSGGTPLFSKVLVTAPNGNTLTFLPNGGRSGLTIVKGDGTLSSSGVIRLAARFTDPTTTGTPSQFDTGLIFASPAFSDDQIRTIPEQGVWKGEFFHADISKANVVQFHRTIARAPTLAEAGLVPLASLTATARAEAQASTATAGHFTFGAPSSTNPNRVDLSTTNGGDFWAVPVGAIAPTSVTAFGRSPSVPNGTGGFTLGAQYDDGAGVAPSARKALIFCSRLGTSDLHCDTTDPTQYAQNSTVNSVELFATSPRFIQLSKMNALYYLRPR